MRLHLVIFAMLIFSVTMCSSCSDESSNTPERRALQNQTSLQRNLLRMRQRIDTPVTETNSVRFNFGSATLRVPNVLIDNPELINSKHPPEIEFLSFSFWYPNMTFGFLFNDPAPPVPSLPPRSFSAYNQAPPIAPFRPFKVYVAEMRYSPDDRNLRAPRPPEILKNLANGDGEPDLFPTRYPGLRQISFLNLNRRKHPGWIFDPKQAGLGHSYIQSADKPYQLYLACGSSCTFTLYSPVSHFQMDGTIYASGDEVARTADQLMHTLDRLMDGWAGKP